MPTRIENNTLIFAEILTTSESFFSPLDIDIFADGITATKYWVHAQDNVAVKYAHIVPVNNTEKTVITCVPVDEERSFIYGEADAVYALLESA